MALTRKMLKAMGIEEEKIEQIIDAHAESTDALKADRDKYKSDAERLPQVQKLYDDLKKQVEDSDDDSYKEKYEEEHKAFEKYKADVDAKELNAKKVSAYKALLKKAGIKDKIIDLIVKGTSMDSVELDENGEIKESDTKVEDIKKEYADYIVKTREEGENPENPPAGEGDDGGANHLSRAAQLAQKHNERLYGVKGENK